MKRDFGTRLSHFTQSLDSVSGAIHDEAARVIHELLVKRLGFHFYEVQTDERLRTAAQVLLTRPVWTNGPTDGTRIKEGERYKGQTTFAFDKGLKLWLTASDQKALFGARDRGADYVNCWDRAADPIPDYWNFEGSGRTRTSIIVPLRHDNQKFGFFSVEHEDLLDATAAATREFERLADAIATIIRRRDHKKESDERKRHVLRDVAADQQSISSISLQKPRVFVGAAALADEKVIATILELLRKDFGNRLTTVYWKDIKESGEVNRQILDAISTSAFGLIYLSEPHPKNQGQFLDNPNAVFEAGVLHGLCSEPGGITEAWFPIREAASVSSPLFFDISTQRIVEVPRHGGVLAVEALRAELRDRITSLLNNV